MLLQNRPSSSSPSSFLHSTFFTRWFPKICSFLIAVFIFYGVEYYNMPGRHVEIPLHVTLPVDSSLVAESRIPDSVEIVISGDDNLVYLIDPSTVKAYADFSDVSEPGIARVPVRLEYNYDIYEESALIVRASYPEVAKIKFKDRNADVK